MSQYPNQNPYHQNPQTLFQGTQNPQIQQQRQNPAHSQIGLNSSQSNQGFSQIQNPQFRSQSPNPQGFTQNQSWSSQQHMSSIQSFQNPNQQTQMWQEYNQQQNQSWNPNQFGTGNYSQFGTGGQVQTQTSTWIAQQPNTWQQNTVQPNFQPLPAQSNQSWKPISNENPANQNFQLHQPQFKQQENNQKVGPIYQESMNVAPPTGKDGKPIEKEDLIRQQQMEYQQQLQVEWNNIPIHEIQSQADQIQRNDEPVPQNFKKQKGFQEEQKEEQLQPQYSSDSETCWYENNQQLIYDFKTQKWIDRREYLVEHPEKYYKHKKYLTERIRSYIQELLQDYKAEQRKPKMAEISEVESHLEANSTIFQNKNRYHQPNTGSRFSRKEGMEDSSFHIQSSIDVNLENSKMLSTYQGGDQIRETFSSQEGFPDIPKRLQDIQGNQMAQTVIKQEESGPSNSQGTESKSQDDFDYAEQVARFSQYLAQNPEKIENLKKEIEEDKKEEEEESKMGQLTRRESVYYKMDSEESIRTSMLGSMKSTRKMNETLKKQSSVPIESIPETIRQSSFATTRSQDQVITFDFKPKPETEKLLKDYQKKAQDQWKIEKFKTYKVKPPFNIRQLKRLEEYGKEEFSDFNRMVGSQLIERGFTHYRDIRGDGNCFYRAVIISYIEILALSGNQKGLIELAEMQVFFQVFKDC